MTTKQVLKLYTHFSVASLNVSGLFQPYTLLFSAHSPNLGQEMKNKTNRFLLSLAMYWITFMLNIGEKSFLIL
jgi:hypothetical protein